VLAIRSLVFVALFYLWSLFWVLLISPLVLGPGPRATPAAQPKSPA
jgi:hypothetical protein